MVALKPLPGVKSKLVMAGNVELATAVFTVRAAVEMPFADVSDGVIARRRQWNNSSEGCFSLQIL